MEIINPNMIQPLWGSDDCDPGGVGGCSCVSFRQCNGSPDYTIGMCPGGYWHCDGYWR